MVNIPKSVHLEGTYFSWTTVTDCIDIVEPAGHVSSSKQWNGETVNHSASDSLRSQGLQKAHVSHDASYFTL